MAGHGRIHNHGHCRATCKHHLSLPDGVFGSGAALAGLESGGRSQLRSRARTRDLSAEKFVTQSVACRMGGGIYLVVYNARWGQMSYRIPVSPFPFRVVRALGICGVVCLGGGGLGQADTGGHCGETVITLRCPPPAVLSESASFCGRAVSPH